ncbi:uncharacterized protein LOC119680615 [Teleopsis dalmanni]|uniref:uncharacterized protein LOC119680544 n=1 Tax=Teleopsis dalmanni TaxID=139649 RepID=UPI0018CF7A37|nr:uncharacterized protein LOC119680544 [Teleopsis dalmanni]XP_037949361.1 uncharacterized protein LOC119680544 [Teleopsis dalmanni]XP_037949362.1 uncharacterized protein LOC119680544 [Teleopsis dalmanni]XP_037949363.1 uncharacterized protein LOC119680544 [Teleopsis dalmanni]XP_037949364.1 uncharacterized protein LOC119680544 [Teleopsis dalmanni]XP_037949457.1 uncharacterized protein LOC119680615 [Teleopsis dalmanni]XP_037949458.1 uncharacterized protein LOC119680615 [Teleopsis dalmanni]XP_0
MSFWKPITDFEKEVVNAQPGRNFIFGSIMPKTISKQHEIQGKKPSLSLYDKQTQKLAAITATEKMTKLKPLGERCRLDDWNNDDNVEKEIKCMVQHVKEAERKKNVAAQTKNKTKSFNDFKTPETSHLSSKSSVSGAINKNIQNKKEGVSGKLYTFLDDDYFKFRAPIPSITTINLDKSKPSGDNKLRDVSEEHV